MNKLEKDISFFDCEIMVHYDYLLYFINTIADDIDLAADIVQETMETAWVKRDKVRQYSNLKKSLITIAKNNLMNYYRRHKTDKLTVPIMEHVPLSQDQEDFISDLINNETRLHILMKIGELRSDYIRIILMHYYYELPLHEISKILDINYNTIVSWHRRALKSLSKLFDKTPYFNESNK